MIEYGIGIPTTTILDTVPYLYASRKEWSGVPIGYSYARTVRFAPAAPAVRSLPAYYILIIRTYNIRIIYYSRLRCRFAAPRRLGLPAADGLAARCLRID